MDIGASQLNPGWGVKVIKASAKAGNYVGDWSSVWQGGEPRKVASKIIKLGMDTKQVIARFEVERQALAMKDHPEGTRTLNLRIDSPLVAL